MQVTTLLNALGGIGALTGYPAQGLRLTDDWSQAKNLDSDILMVGTIPPSLRDDRKMSMLVDATQSWVNQPNRQVPLPDMALPVSDAVPDSQTTVSAQGPLAAIIGVQSPSYSQRSIVALLADGPQGFALLNQALGDSGKRAAIFGSVAVIRDSGVNSLRVGDIYYVGHLPWWERVWNALATHPVLMAFIAMLSVVLVALLLWRGLLILTRRRLSPDDRD